MQRGEQKTVHFMLCSHSRLRAQVIFCMNAKKKQQYIYRSCSLMLNDNCVRVFAHEL